MNTLPHMSDPCTVTISITSKSDTVEVITPLGWMTNPTFPITLPYPNDIEQVCKYTDNALQSLGFVPFMNDAGYEDVVAACNADLLKINAEILYKEFHKDQNVNKDNVTISFTLGDTKDGNRLEIRLENR